MRNLLTCLLAAFFLILALGSCRKETSLEKMPNILTGTWVYVSTTAQTQSTESYADATGNYATVTVANYTTTDNSGTVVITPDSMISKGLGYTINAVATGYDYINNVLIDSASLPFNYTLSPTDASASYQLIGSDSLFFPDGGLIGAPAGLISNGTGARFTISGNILTLITQFSDTTNQLLFGVRVKEVDQALITTTLRKQ